MVAGLLAALAALPAVAFERSEERAPCRVHSETRLPWFGDLHVHTRYSLDASTQGTRTSPAEAYRFAKGEALGLHPFDAAGTPDRNVKLRRPLAFAAVTDHAELFGEVSTCNAPGQGGYDSIVCRVYRGWPRMAFFLMNGRGSPRFSFCGEGGALCALRARGPWQEMQEAAEAAYDRSAGCAFTSFVGYEWTKSAETASNLHRNVIFRNHLVPEVPANAIDFPTPKSLWETLQSDCRDEQPGCDAIVIPHNSNISGGLMFVPNHLSDGTPYNSRDARSRAYNEPLVEIMQHKGDSECRRGAGTEDELCGFETLPYDTFMGRFLSLARRPAAPSNFVRTALGTGLALGRELGTNPFRYGIIASTDTHLGTPGLVSEENYPGHGGAGIPVGEVLPDVLLDPIEYNPGGLAVVWAEENSRDALFAAMRRRETYGTSGPRIEFRLFGGYDFPERMCDVGSFAELGYGAGVPMGGTLTEPPTRSSAPVFAATALQDAEGNLLERMQIIKLWLEDGIPQERVIDIAGVPATQTVDPATCVQPPGVGVSSLCALWRDPDFDPDSPALYYGRVVEVQSCRWSAYSCNAAGIDCDASSTMRSGYESCCDDTYPKTIQERAWTSPIWYKP